MQIRLRAREGKIIETLSVQPSPSIRCHLGDACVVILMLGNISFRLKSHHNKLSKISMH